MNIISINIEFAKSTTPHDTAEAFRPLAPDVVLFNEVPGGDWTGRVGAALDMPYVYCGRISSANHTDKYKSILSRTPLSGTREIPLDGKGWKPISAVRAETDIDGVRLALYALHIPGAPEREGSACAFLADELRKNETCPNVLAGGDYNQQPDDAALEAMSAGGFRSLWRELGVDTTALFTHNALNPVQRTGIIDHFFLRSADDSLRIADGGILDIEPPLADHKPIWIELRGA